jgi:hypothetical protein
MQYSFTMNFTNNIIHAALVNQTGAGQPCGYCYQGFLYTCACECCVTRVLHNLPDCRFCIPECNSPPQSRPRQHRY